MKSERKQDWKNRPWAMLAMLLTIALLYSPAARTQQEVTGTLGSPDAARFANSKVLPVPALKFGGFIKQNAAQSKPWWPPQVAPSKGAPNILLIMTDDVGFGAPSTFGGVIPTPALDRIARDGLRYTNFHSTAFTDPSRAHHGTQPPLGRLRRNLGGRIGLSRLQQHHRQRQRYHRQDSPR